jgi:hypothetical protein
MKNAMAPRVRKDSKKSPSERTQYQLHKTQQTVFADKMKETYDYTEHKLARYIETVEDPEKRKFFENLLQDYVRGNVAIAWEKGEPVWLKITKE